MLLCIGLASTPFLMKENKKINETKEEKDV